MNVAEMNDYAHELTAQPGLAHKSRLGAWGNVGVSEMYCFLATVLLMGLVRKNTIGDYWSTDRRWKHTFLLLFFTHTTSRPCL